MVELYLMASHGYPPGLVLHREQGLFGVAKDCQPLLYSPGSRHGMKRLDNFSIRQHPYVEPWKPINNISEANLFLMADSMATRPVLIDVQDAYRNSILFSFGISEQCTRHEKILQFLMSGSNEAGGELDLSVISDLMGLQALTIDKICQNPFATDCGSCTCGVGVRPSLFYPNSELCAQRPLVEGVGDLAHGSDIPIYSDGQISFTGLNNELKDILSVDVEYYLSKNSTKWRKQSVLIPHVNRLDCSEAKVNVSESSMLLENVKFAPAKSPDKIKLKPLPRKKTNKKTRERDLYKKNYFRACESLLSIMVDKKHNGKTAILLLKKSGPELPQLLTQFSASIAGTGIAVLFTVACKAAYSRVPFSLSKLFNTGIGFGLVWLSWAVNRLRDTVIYINKNSGKINWKEEQMLRKLDRCVNEVFFRAATLMAVAVLRFA